MNIRPLEYTDHTLLADLQPTDWPDILPYYAFYTNSKFCFPIKVVIDNKIVGIGTTIIHYDIAWLAHIIVHPDYRKRGIGQRITQTLVDSLQTKNCDTIYLIATDLGTPVYEKIDFETETAYLLFKNLKTDPNWLTSENIILITDYFKEQIASIDRQVSGEDRIFQIEKHLTSGYVYQQDKVVEGYYLPALGEGLIVANTTSAGLELMKMRLNTNNNAAFPADNLSASEFLHQHHYKKFRTAKRMRLGAKKKWEPANLYNRIGGNLG